MIGLSYLGKQSLEGEQLLKLDFVDYRVVLIQLHFGTKKGVGAKTKTHLSVDSEPYECLDCRLKRGLTVRLKNRFIVYLRVGLDIVIWL